MKARLLRFCVVALVATGFLAAAPRASADQIFLKLDSTGPNVTFKDNGTSRTLGGGPFHWTQQSPINTNYNSSITTYCIDIDHYIGVGNTYGYFTFSDLKMAPTIGNNTTKVNAINELFDRYYTSSLANAGSEAAFQLALWELVYDGGTSKSLSSGRITDDTTTGDGKAAKALLDSLGNPGANDHALANAHLEVVLSKSGNQDQIMVVPNPKGVPAPPAVMLAGIGVLALIGRARWNRRTPTAA